MESAGTNKVWLQKLKEERGELVKQEKQVELRFDLAWVWEGFCILARQRATSSDPNPISLSDIHAYVKLAGISCYEDQDFFLKMVMKLDDVWLDHHHTSKRRREEQRNKAAKKKSRRGR